MPAATATAATAAALRSPTIAYTHTLKSTISAVILYGQRGECRLEWMQRPEGAAVCFEAPPQRDGELVS